MHALFEVEEFNAQAQHWSKNMHGSEACSLMRMSYEFTTWKEECQWI